LACEIRQLSFSENPMRLRNSGEDLLTRLLVPPDIERIAAREECQPVVGQLVMDIPGKLFPIIRLRRARVECRNDDTGGSALMSGSIKMVPYVIGIVLVVSSALQPVTRAKSIQFCRSETRSDDNGSERLHQWL